MARAGAFHYFGCPAAAILLAGAVALLPGVAGAQSFAGKTIEVYIGSAAGGGYDLYGRFFARNFGRHLPGHPTVVAQNMPGAGGLRAANFVYNAAPKDGTALGLVAQTVAQEEVLGTPGVQYQAAMYNWIGRISPNIDVTITWQSSKATSIAEAKTHEAPVAGTGQGNVAEVMPRVLNAIIGTKFKVISGYEGANAAMMAMERGEVAGAATSWTTLKTTKKAWLDEKKIHVLVQYTPERTPGLPDVPALIELGETPEAKQVLALYASSAVVGRSIMAPPGLPAANVKALRAAFDKMTKDADFLADVEKSKLEFDPMPGEELQRVIEESAKVSDAVREKARAARGL